MQLPLDSRTPIRARPCRDRADPIEAVIIPHRRTFRSDAPACNDIQRVALSSQELGVPATNFGWETFMREVLFASLLLQIMLQDGRLGAPY